MKIIHREVKIMTYEEMCALKKGDRFQVLLHGTWRSGTFHGTINGADAAMWFAYDHMQIESRGPICTKIYTGLQFKPEYWNDPKEPKVFRWPSEEDLNAELLAKMETV